MSVRVMTEVWTTSTQKGSALLLLLAIADNANDEGHAWPSQETLARKTRMSVRQIRRLVDNLVEAGEIRVEQERKGSSTLNHYYVTPPGQVVPLNGESPGHPGSVHPDIAVSAEPSRTRQKATPSVPKDRDQVFDAVAVACGIDLGSLTRTMGRAVGHARAEIVAAHPGVEPDELAAEVKRRAARYRHAHPEWELTPDSLRKWWASLAAPSENGWKDLKPRPGESPAEWVARVQGHGLTRTKVEATLAAEWGLEPGEVNAFVGSP